MLPLALHTLHCPYCTLTDVSSHHYVCLDCFVRRLYLQLCLDCALSENSMYSTDVSRLCTYSHLSGPLPSPSPLTDVVLSYKGVAYENNSIVSIGADYPANISCSLEGIDSTEANVTWYYPNGLPVGGALGHSIFQTNTSSSELKWVESVLTWQPTRMYDGSFNGEGFYQCHVTTTHGLEGSVHLGMFLRPPGLCLLL